MSLKEEEENYLPGNNAKTIILLSWYCNTPTSGKREKSFLLFFCAKEIIQ